MIPDLSRRADQLELMELPGRDEEVALRTIDQFRITNPLLSRYRTILKRWILADMQTDPSREYHLADLGAGGLDITEWLACAARSRGLKLRITAVEGDASIAEHVRLRTSRDSGINVVCSDALEWLRTSDLIDYAFCNHFLHHLPEPVIINLLTLLAARVRRRFVINDLLRSRWSYLGFWLFGRVFLPRSYAWADGLTSIRRGFLPGELLEMIQRAGLAVRVTVHSMAPGRLVVVGTQHLR